MYFRFGGPFLPEIVRLDVPAPEALRGLSALFVADLHFGCTRSPIPHTLPIVDMIRDLAPSLILWGGDYAEPGCHRALFPLLAALQPPLGAFGVIGNNDRGENFSAFPALQLLVNRSVRVGNLPLRIIGLDDARTGSPDLSLIDPPSEAVFQLLLSHSPLALRRMPSSLWPNLTLCGHTHGGQIALCGLSPYSFGYEHFAARRDNFFLTGSHAPAPSARVVVSNGIGTSLFPVRIGAPPQLHLITFAE